jgi:hypothetical protein
LSAPLKPHLPLKVLMGLSALVLLAHLVLLQGVPMTLGLAQPQPAQPFITRTVTPTPLQPPPLLPQPAAKPPVASPISSDEPATTERVQGTPSTDSAPLLEPASSPNSAAATPPLDSQPATQAPEAPAPSRPAQAPLASHFTMPGSVRITYRVESNKFPFNLTGINAELLWQQTAEGYDIRQEMGALGKTRVRTSRGQVTAAGLAPVRFSDKWQSEVAAHFDHENQKVTFSANTPDVPLLPGGQDQLSIQVQLAGMLASDPGRFPPGTTMTIQIIGPRGSDTWLIAVEGEENLILPGGEMATLKLIRKPRKEFDQQMELWMAPALGYLPARIRVTEPNGDVGDVKWLSAEPPG